ncbi:MAG: iron-sulfur cluster assembly scaffold protein [Thermodesulfobacteriota bacterium]
MAKKFEESGDMLQEEILKKLRKRYTKIVLDHWMNPKNMKKIENPDGYAKFTGICGDTMEIFLKIEREIIVDCGFLTDGCGTTIACGGMMTEMVKGKRISEAMTVNEKKILEALGGLPKEDRHCALLTVITLRNALADYLFNKREPWKRLYRKSNE